MEETVSRKTKAARSLFPVEVGCRIEIARGWKGKGHVA